MSVRKCCMAVITLAVLLAAPLHALAAEGAPADRAMMSALLDRYIAAVNAHDLATFPAIFTENYIQHSGRSPSGLAAQTANFTQILKTWPDIQMQVEDRIIGDDKIVARVTFAATHSQTALGVAPTGRKITFRTIDIWRVEGGKLAEHWDLVDTAGLLKQLKGE